MLQTMIRKLFNALKTQPERDRDREFPLASAIQRGKRVWQ